MALQKAVDSLELKTNGLQLLSLKEKSVPELWEKLAEKSDERIFVIFEMLRKGVTIEKFMKQRRLIISSFILLHSLIEIEKQIASISLQDVTKERMQYL